jgi:hypothetical protein
VVVVAPGPRRRRRHPRSPGISGPSVAGEEQGGGAAGEGGRAGEASKQATANSKGRRGGVQLYATRSGGEEQRTGRGETERNEDTGAYGIRAVFLYACPPRAGPSASGARRWWLDAGGGCAPCPVQNGTERNCQLVAGHFEMAKLGDTLGG